MDLRAYLTAEYRNALLDYFEELFASMPAFHQWICPDCRGTKVSFDNTPCTFCEGRGNTPTDPIGYGGRPGPLP